MKQFEYKDQEGYRVEVHVYDDFTILIFYEGVYMVKTSIIKIINGRRRLLEEIIY